MRRRVAPSAWSFINTPRAPCGREKSRTLQCVHSIFTDVPSYFLQRSGAWFLFAAERNAMLEKLLGGFSLFMGMVLQCFFTADGNSIDKGILLHAQSGDAAFVIRAPCAIGLNCMNVMNRMPVDAVAVGLECASYAHLRQHSNETIFAMVDAFIEGHETMDPDGLAAMEPAFVRSNVNE